MFIAVCKCSTLIAQSSIEAKSYCLVEVCRELLWIRSFPGEILANIPCWRIFQDNTSTINMVSHEAVSERSRHMDVKFYFVMKLKSAGKVGFLHSNSAEMCADIFTKDLFDDVYARHAAVMQGIILDA